MFFCNLSFIFIYGWWLCSTRCWPYLQLGLHYSLSLQHTHTHTHTGIHTHGLTVCRWRQFSLKYFNILSFMLNATPVRANCKLRCPANLRPQRGHHFLSSRKCFNMYKKLQSNHATTNFVYTLIYRNLVNILFLYTNLQCIISTLYHDYKILILYIHSHCKTFTSLGFKLSFILYNKYKTYLELQSFNIAIYTLRYIGSISCYDDMGKACAYD